MDSNSTKVFSLEGKSLKLNTADDIEPHIANLVSMDGVEEVRLSGNTLGVGACKRLGEVLATKKTLRSAQLADIFTGRVDNEIPEALSSLLTAILNLPTLTSINLNDNAFGLKVQAPLVAFLSSHVPLQHLYLNNNGLGPHAGILIADALSALHSKKNDARKKDSTANVPDLETVICGRNRLENGSMKAWARCYSLHNKVRVVKMVQNGIRQEGISHLLSDGLYHANSIEILDLQDNTFTLTGSRALADAIAEWPCIRELAVGDCLLGGKGTVLLADALSKGKNTKLVVLRLFYNDIHAAALAKLTAAAKKGLPALKRLEINGNKFEEDDPSVLELSRMFDERKKAAAAKEASDTEIDGVEWGLDELDELEGADSDEEEEDEEEDEGIKKEDIAEKLIRDAEEAQEEPTVQVQDVTVDQLAKKLEKTII